MIVYGMKGVGLREATENGRPAPDRIALLSLKVIVYGRKGDNYIEKISPLLVVSNPPYQREFRPFLFFY